MGVRLPQLQIVTADSFMGWTDSIAGSVRGWTDRQGTTKTGQATFTMPTCEKHPILEA
jgi:hypothetical protein